MEKMLCDLDDYLFIFVYLTALFLNPIYIYSSIFEMLSTYVWIRSLTKIPFYGLSFSYIFSFMSFPSRSWIYSLYISIKLHRIKCVFDVSFFVIVIIWLNVLGMIPLDSSFALLPIIVCVFPHPVWP